MLKDSFKMRPYQETAIRETMAALKEHQKVGAVLPTGAGKSECFIGVTSQFIAENPGKSVLILSHLSLLTTQTKDRFKLRAPHLQVGILQADVRPHPDCDVVISTVQSSRIEAKIERFNDKLSKDVGLVIIDEMHYLTTESYNTALSYFPNAKQFGVTATPFREGKLMTSYFDKISFSISLQELINQGYLVEPKLNQIVYQTDGVEDVIALLVKTYKEKEDGNKAIFFMQTIEDAKSLRNAFEDVRVSAESVTSDMVGEHRDEILKKFNNHDLNILTTVNVLTAGFDAPNVRAIFMPYATQSPTLYMQRIGRGLRPFEGKTECRVYVVGDAPSISRKQYEEVHRHVLNGTAEWKEYDTIQEDLLYNLPDEANHQYNWTVQAVDIAQRLDALGVTRVADMLRTKQFPKKFMGDLAKLTQTISTLPKTQYSGAVTAKQVDMLRRYGFDVDQAQKLSKNEAGMVISGMQMMFQAKGPFVLTSGAHAGKHVSALPYRYKQIVISKFPNSAVAQMIRQWNQEKRA